MKTNMSISSSPVKSKGLGSKFYFFVRNYNPDF